MHYFFFFSFSLIEKVDLSRRHHVVPSRATLEFNKLAQIIPNVHKEFFYENSVAGEYNFILSNLPTLIAIKSKESHF